MRTRVIYGTLFGALTLAMMLLSTYTRVLFFLVCGVISTWEMRRAVMKMGYRIPAWFVYAVCVCCSAAIAFDHVGYAYPIFMILLVGVFSQLILVGNISVKDIFASAGMVMYPLSNLMLLMYCARSEVLWAPIFLNSVLPAIVSDTFALLGGRRFGKHKLSPQISPKKTVEGLICGVVMGALSGLAVHFILDAFELCLIPMWAEMIAALLASLAGALGDLAASAVKREAGIKDYSNLIPGHGGIMDRVDSSLFAAPVVYMLYAMFI